MGQAGRANRLAPGLHTPGPARGASRGDAGAPPKPVVPYAARRPRLALVVPASGGRPRGAPGAPECAPQGRKADPWYPDVAWGRGVHPGAAGRYPCRGGGGRGPAGVWPQLGGSPGDFRAGQDDEGFFRVHGPKSPGPVQMPGG